MNRRIIIFVIYTFCFSHFSLSQSFIKLSGRAIDAESQEPLAFATVSIPGTSMGVVTNSVGEFEFSFPDGHKDDSLHFSMVGYEAKSWSIREVLKSKKAKFSLKNRIILLDEVVVSTDELDAEEVLTRALQNVKNNYPVKPFEFDVFYRDFKIENSKCVSIFESAATIYDRGYTKESREKVTLNHVRKSLSTQFKFRGFRITNSMREMLYLNDVRHGARALKWKKNNYTLSIEGYESLDDRLVYKIKAVNDWKFYFYVDIENYAIRKVELDYVWEDGVAENTWTNGDTIRHQQRWAKEILEFQEIEGTLYPKYHNFHCYGKAFDTRSDSLLFDYELFTEYMVNEINRHPEVKPNKKSLMDSNEIIENQESHYDPEFWENYNAVKLNPRRRLLLEELEESNLLGKQL